MVRATGVAVPDKLRSIFHPERHRALNLVFSGAYKGFYRLRKEAPAATIPQMRDDAEETRLV